MEDDDDEDGAQAAANNIVTTLLAERELQETQAYLSRGRTLQAVKLDELHQTWAENFKAYLAYGDHTKRQAFEDTDAELRLRKAPQPHHLVKQYWPKVQERVTLASIERHEEIEDSMRQDIERLLNTKKS
jgi:TPR repeat protein